MINEKSSPSVNGWARTQIASSVLLHGDPTTRKECPRPSGAGRPVELDDSQGLALEPIKAQLQPVNALNVNRLAASAIGIGNGIRRQLTSLGHRCDVVAPSLIPKSLAIE
jgi:hypothetical protein